MSLLLEALRKSENQRRLGALPSIHSPAPDWDSEPRRPRRVAAVALALAGLAVLGWLTWQQYRPPRDDAAGTAVTGAVPGSPGAESGAPAPHASAEAPPPDARAAESIQPIPSPVERLPEGPALTREAEPSRAAPGEPAGAATQPSSAPAEPATGPAPDSGPGRAVPAAADPDAASATRPWTPPAPGAISYWQLPEATREQVGELRITVLVYAERPEDRFILLNGRRQVEGDEPRPGLVVQEIQPEGVVFSYRLYRFVLQR